MPYQSILGPGAGVVPNSAGKANPFASGFKPGQYYVNSALQHAMQAVQTPYAPVQKEDSTRKGLLGVINKTGHVVTGVGRAIASPFVDVGKEANKNIVQPIVNPQPSKVSPAQIALAQQHAQEAAKAGKITPQTVKDIGQISNASQRLQALNIAIHPQKTNQDVQSFVKPILAQRAEAQKRGAGDLAQIVGTIGVGGETASAAKGAQLLHSVLAGAAAGALGGGGAEVSNNPNASGKSIAKQAGIGAALGGALPVLGHGLSAVTGKRTPTIPTTTPKSVSPVTDNAHLLGPGQKKLSAVTSSTKATTATPGKSGAVFGSAATTPAKVAAVADKTKATVASIDGKLAAIDRGEVQATPMERKSLFQSRQVLSGNAPAIRPETQGMIKAVSEAHAPSMAAEANPTTSTLVGQLDKSQTKFTPTPKPPEFTKQVEDTLRSVRPVNQTTSNAKGTLGEIQNLFTPGGGQEGKTIANDLRATTGKMALDRNQETIAAKPDVNFFNKMSPADHTVFIQKVESGIKQDTPELQAMADKLRTAQEADYKLGQSIKPDLAHLQNYFPRAGFWDNSKREVDAFLQKWQQPSLGGKPTALEHRSIPTVYDGIKAGLKPKETNPAIIALNSRAQLLRAKAADDFFKEQVAAGHSPQLVQDYIDRVMGKGLQGSATFRTARDAAYGLNNLQLGLSGFHVTSTGINAIVSQFSNGLQDIAHGNLGKGIVDMAKAPFAPLDYLFKGNKIIKDYRAGNVTKDIANIAEGGGRIGSQVDYRTSGLSKSLEQLKSGSLKEAGKGIAAAPFRAFSTAAKPVMEYWVPRLKAGATKELIDRKLAELGPNASATAQRAAKADAIDSIDNRFGQLVKDNLMWNKAVKDGSSILMRSPGWNIGTVRELGGGVTDLATKTLRGKGLSERSSYTASLAATTMLIGTAMSYLFTGKAPSSPIDYFYPKTGKIDKNGNEERVSLPTYAKDVFAFSHNPAQTIQNKANPLISIGSQLAHNKDYFGNQTRNPEDSAGTQLKQTGSFLAKSVLPFSVTNSNQRVEKSASTKTQSFFGLNPAPGYITKSPFEQKVSAALNQATGSKSLTPEEQALVNSKSQAKQSQQGGDSSQIQALIDSGKITQKQGDNLKKSSSQSSLANSFAYLVQVDKPTAARLISQASPQNRQKLATPDLIKSLQTTTRGKAKQSNKDAASKLLQALNK